MTQAALRALSFLCLLAAGVVIGLVITHVLASVHILSALALLWVAGGAEKKRAQTHDLKDPAVLEALKKQLPQANFHQIYSNFDLKKILELGLITPADLSYKALVYLSRNKCYPKSSDQKKMLDKMIEAQVISPATRQAFENQDQDYFQRTIGAIGAPDQDPFARLFRYQNEVNKHDALLEFSSIA
ncbi:MAG: hypothetical protein V4487_08340 [Chlamydiota bacterium]